MTEEAHEGAETCASFVARERPQSTQSLSIPLCRQLTLLISLPLSFSLSHTHACTHSAWELPFLLLCTERDRKPFYESVINLSPFFPFGAYVTRYVSSIRWLFWFLCSLLRWRVALAATRTQRHRRALMQTSSVQCQFIVSMEVETKCVMLVNTIRKYTKIISRDFVFKQ